jgi:hypothetical protein
MQTINTIQTNKVFPWTSLFITLYAASATLIPAKSQKFHFGEMRVYHIPVVKYVIMTVK